MRSFFVAYGPAFKKRLRVEGRDDLENVDLYPLMCKILEIDPLPNNGSFERIKFILRDEESNVDVNGNLTNPYPVLFASSNDDLLLVPMIAWAPLVVLIVSLLIHIGVKFCQRRKKRIKENGNASVGYRLLRNASPETHVDTTNKTISNNTSSKIMKNNDNNGASAATATAVAGKLNGGQKRFQRSAAARSKSPIEDGRRQLVRLSDEEQSSDENEL